MVVISFIATIIFRIRVVTYRYKKGISGISILFNIIFWMVPLRIIRKISNQKYDALSQKSNWFLMGFASSSVILVLINYVFSK